MQKKGPLERRLRCICNVKGHLSNLLDIKLLLLNKIVVMGTIVRRRQCSKVRNL